MARPPLAAPVPAATRTTPMRRCWRPEQRCPCAQRNGVEKVPSRNVGVHPELLLRGRQIRVRLLRRIATHGSPSMASMVRTTVTRLPRVISAGNRMERVGVVLNTRAADCDVKRERATRPSKSHFMGRGAAGVGRRKCAAAPRVGQCDQAMSRGHARTTALSGNRHTPKL